MDDHPHHTFDVACWCQDTLYDFCISPARSDGGPCLCCGLDPVEYSPLATPPIVWGAI